MTDNKQYPELPDFETVEQHIYGACRRYVSRDMLEPILNLIRDGIDADRAMRVAQPAMPPSYEGSSLIGKPGGSCTINFHFTNTEEADAWHEAVTESFPLAVRAAPLTNTHVQHVPDKCDRIVWRGHYYHLPIKAAPSQDAEDAERFRAFIQAAIGDDDVFRAAMNQDRFEDIRTLNDARRVLDAAISASRSARKQEGWDD